MRSTIWDGLQIHLQVHTVYSISAYADVRFRETGYKVYLFWSITHFKANDHRTLCLFTTRKKMLEQPTKGYRIRRTPKPQNKNTAHLPCEEIAWHRASRMDKTVNKGWCMLASWERLLPAPCFIDHHKIDVTRTEWSADPVMYIGSVGCQSTLVIDELCGSVLSSLSWPCTWRDA